MEKNDQVTIEGLDYRINAHTFIYPLQPNNICLEKEEPWYNMTLMFVVSSNFSFPLTSLHLHTITIYETYEVSAELPYDTLPMENLFGILVVMGNGHGTRSMESGMSLVCTLFCNCYS